MNSLGDELEMEWLRTCLFGLLFDAFAEEVLLEEIGRQQFPK